MVNLVEVRTTRGEGDILINIHGSFLIPVYWLYCQYLMGNVQIKSSSLTKREGNSLLTEFMLDLFNDFQMMGYPYDGVEYLILKWEQDKQWYGIGPANNPVALLKTVVKVEDEPRVITRYNCQYKLDYDANKIVYVGGDYSEYLYNRQMINYFGSKLAIRLSSLAPIKGELDSILSED